MSKPRPLVAANWKCNGTQQSCIELINLFNTAGKHDVDCVVAPTFLHISLVQAHLRNPKWAIAAQNCSVKNGAFTGEVSVEMLLDAGIRTIIIGHSERRTLYGETDAVVAAKVERCVAAGVHIILCVGETKEQYDAGRSVEVTLSQLDAVAAKVGPASWGKISIAFEPVFAIGTGIVATPEHIEKMHREIRGWLAKAVDEGTAHQVRILYGGSVTAKTAAEMYAIPNVNGFLVGGASLKPEFVDIINATSDRSNL